MSRLSSAKAEPILAALLCAATLAAVAAGLGANAPLPLWLREDGPVEWLTVIGLLLLAGLCFHRAAAGLRRRAMAFTWVSALLGAAFVFGAGEEVSWGQRLLGLPTPDWFAQHNRQSEINVHNLVLRGHDLTKLLFGRVLVLALATYMLVLPLLYRRARRVRGLADRLGVPVPRGRQALMFLALAAAIHLPEVRGRESELFECAAALQVLLIFVNPANRQAFARTPG